MTGEFSFVEKMKTSIKSNFLLYSAMAVVAVIVGIIYIVKFDVSAQNIPATIAAASNAYGLFLLIAMLGHGLVNIPRRAWRRSNREKNLKRYQFEAAKYDAKVFNAKQSLTLTLRKVRKADSLTHGHDTNRKYVDVIISKCPPEYDKVNHHGGVDFDVEYKKLASLHEKVMTEVHAIQLYQV